MKMLMIVPIISLSACATVSQDYQEYLDSKAVEARVTERWDALVKRDNVKVYNYLTPSYREMTSQEDYIKSVNTRIVWDDFDIVRTRCEAQVCKVNVESKYHIPPMFGFPRGMNATEIVRETWIYDSSDWYYLPPQGK
jgi:hypothetical protein